MGIFKKKTGRVYAGPEIKCVYAGPEQMGYWNNGENETDADDVNTGDDNNKPLTDGPDADGIDAEKLKKEETRKTYPSQHADLNRFSGVYAGPGMMGGLDDGNGINRMKLVYAAPSFFNNRDNVAYVPKPDDGKSGASVPDDGVREGTGDSVYCQNCGTKITEVRKFCPECGAKLLLQVRI